MNDKINRQHDSEEFVQSDCDELIKETRCDIADRNLAETEQDYNLEIMNGLDLVFALANNQKISPDVLNSAIVDSAIYEIDNWCPSNPSDDNKCNWLNAIEILSSSEKSLSDLYSGNEHADNLRVVIKNAIHARVKTIENSEGWWKFGDLAEDHILKNGVAIEPWNTILQSDITKEIPADAPLEALRGAVTAWVESRLSDQGFEYIKNLVLTDERWKDIYRDKLNNLTARKDNVITTHPAFRLGHPLNSVSLPHLGKNVSLKISSADNGLLVDYPGKTPALSDWNDEGVIEAKSGDEVTDELLFKFNRIKPDIHCESFSAYSALASILRDPDYPEEKTVDVIRPAVDLFFRENGWFDRLSQLSDSFDKEEDIDSDDVLLAERALEIRAVMDELLHRHLNPEIHDLISKLDERLSDVKNAVFTISEENYYEILEFSQPESGSWWAVRLDLDRDLPHHLLYDAFSDQD